MTRQLVLAAMFLSFVGQTESSAGHLVELVAQDPYYFELNRPSSFIAVDDDVTVVGSPGANRGAGLAYVFDNSTGNQLFRLRARNAQRNDSVGHAVAVSGDTALIGAPHVYHVTDQSEAAVYFFDIRTGSQLRKIESGQRRDEFGAAVDLEGTTAVVGAPLDDRACRVPDVACNSGLVYVFDATTGQHLLQITPEFHGRDQLFGRSVALEANRVLIGASGAAYLFDVTTGAQLDIFRQPAGARTAFGITVAMSGDTIVIGDLLGKAYVFDAVTGDQLHILESNSGATTDRFGNSVDVDADILLVAAASQQKPGSHSGTVDVFDTLSGQRRARLRTDEPGPPDLFGQSVALDGKTAVIAARDSVYLVPDVTVFVPEPGAMTIQLIGVSAVILPWLLLGKHRLAQFGRRGVWS